MRETISFFFTFQTKNLPNAVAAFQAFQLNNSFSFNKTPSTIQKKQKKKKKMHNESPALHSDLVSGRGQRF